MENFSLKQKVLKGFIWLSTAAFLSQAITWFVTIFVIRLLAPSDYGLLAMSNTFVYIVTTVSNLGINAALIQTKELKENDVRNIFGVVVISIVVCSVLTYILAPYISLFYDEERVTLIVRVMILNFCIIGFYLIPQSLIIREMDFKAKAKIDTYARVGSSLTTLVLAYYGYGVWALVIGMMMLHFIKLIGYNLSVAFPGMPMFNWRESKDFIFYGAAVTGDRLLYAFYNQIDKIIVGKILGDALLGIYSVAINLASMPSNKILPIINQVSFSSYSRIQDNKERLARNIIRATRVVSGIAFPVFFGMSAVAIELIPLMLGKQWVSATLPFQVLCLVMPLKALSTIFPPAVFAIGEPKVNLTNKVVTCTVMIIAFAIGSHWGIFGVCYAWLFVYPVVLLFTTSRCLKVMSVPLFNVLKEIGFPFFASSLMFASIYLFRISASQLTSLTLLFSAVGLGIIVYFLFVVLLYKDKYMEILNLVRSRR